METLAGMAPAGVDWHRRAFELASELGRIGPSTDAGDYAAALRAVAQVDRALPALLAELIDEGRQRGVGLSWRTIAAALGRHPDTVRDTFAPRNRHRLGRTPGGRGSAGRQPAGNNADSVAHVA